MTKSPSDIDKDAAESKEVPHRQRDQQKTKSTSEPFVTTDNQTPATPSTLANRDPIRESVLKSGGEPFGAPMGHGVSSLTVASSRHFKQKSFFGFETYEQAAPHRLRNPFTKHGASRFKGRYQQGPDLSARRTTLTTRLKKGIVSWLRRLWGSSETPELDDNQK